MWLSRIAKVVHDSSRLLHSYAPVNNSYLERYHGYVLKHARYYCSARLHIDLIKRVWKQIKTAESVRTHLHAGFPIIYALITIQSTYILEILDSLEQMEQYVSHPRVKRLLLADPTPRPRNAIA